MSRKRIPDENRKAIAQALREGIKPSVLVKEYGISKTTVCVIAKENNIDIVHTQTKKANEVVTAYNKAERAKLLDKFFDKIGDQLENNPDANDLRNLSIAMGTIIDKRRLEDGEVTERTEVNSNEARERIASRLDELAERRGKKEAAS